MVRRCYATLNNRFGCGALAIGELARRDFIDWGIKADRIRFLPYSIDPVHADCADSRALGEGGVRFLYLGVFEPRKGLDVLVAAFARIAVEYPNASLTLVGADHSQGKYQRQAESLGIERVQFKTPVLAADIGEIIDRNDVLVLPSRFDGWGMVLSEGASMARALISTTACGAAYHLIEDGVAGYRVPPGNVEALVNAMRNYCEQPQTITTHGRYSSKLFKELTPQMNARRLQTAIAELCTAT
jgi:glycosyltransferase involved in cell wall biosynthesis